MAAPVRVVLLACGSFNPVTNMHLRMFEIARDSLQRTGRYKVIAGIVSPVNDKYGKKDLVPAKHRCEMLKLALKSIDWIRLDTWESEQSQWLETAKILSHFKGKLDSIVNSYINSNSTDTPVRKRRKVASSHQEHEVHSLLSYDDQGTVQLRLLCGADLLESFATPGLWADEDIKTIVASYGLVCIARDGSDAEKFIYENDVLYKYQNNIHLVKDWIPNEISSTKIRRALKRGESVKYLLLDPVIDYIHKHKLYAPPFTDK